MYVDRVVETQVPLDPKLTTAPDEPGPPPANCVDPGSGAKVPCGKDVATAIDALRAWGRRMAGMLKEIAALQPEGTEQ